MRIIYRYAFVGAIFAFAFLFALGPSLEGPLHLLGYTDQFASRFPFIERLYSRIALSPRIAPINIIYFQLGGVDKIY